MEAETREERQGNPEKGGVSALAWILQKAILLYLKTEKPRDSWKPHYVVSLLNNQHQWRVDGLASDGYAGGSNYTHLAAEAFLIALESECPPPDWIPGI